MSEQNTLAVEAAAGTDTTNDRLSEAPRDAAERAVREERARVREIQSIVRAASLDVALADEMIAAGTSLDGARKRVLDELAKRGERAPISAVHSGIETVVDETVTRRAAIRDALLHRAMPGHFAITEAARPWAGYSMREIMRRCLEMRGVRTDGMSVTQMWERTFTSASDLPYILLDAANKSLRAGYESAPRTFTVWCRRATAPDFRQIHRVQLSGAPSLLEVKAGGEYRRGTVSDAKETYQLLTYGRVIGFNRQVIVNDDMDAIGRLPMLAARAAADLESDVVYSVLTANAALSDGIALFHSSHGNLAGTGSAISVTSLGAGRAAMRKQKGLEGRPINARPAFLIVPAAVEMVAEQYTSADFVSAKSSDINPFRQGRPSALTVVTEPRLDDSSATAWYLSADPAQIDTVEYAYLEGEEGVYLETRMGFDVDGIEMKVRLDFAAKAIDFRGLYKNPGA